MTRAAITEGLRLIFQGIAYLEKASPHLPFTIDGRLGGDIGEVIAAFEYDVVLHDVSQAKHDAVTSDGRNVQIMATFKDFLTFRTVPDYYLGFKLYPDGQHEEIFNGPGQVIADRFIGREVIADLFLARKGIGVNLLSFPIAELRRLSERVPEHERIPKRN
jgi:hypothetical protein